MKIGDCPQCVEYLQDPWRHSTLLESCASVALSNGKTTQQMIIAFMNVFHHDGHRDEPRFPGEPKRPEGHK